MESLRIWLSAEEQDFGLIHRFPSEESSWARGIPIEVVRQACMRGDAPR